ncbi:hypothetical protein TPHA_0D04470 [Tetrapisispora phaffii CBS 4417]|uniref:SURP motif domain-containing protein n=1 Tax=Tetrapisispora phaffii (strain ATCC 24235 / CBS 4417 / NBRC 1672 / NRRL Y-8282 / UCD 70-5) TaxID=1071381 RepID=G8BS06_TETPH|nr:hypothetical protein TPHA_0D04470 [Tetrapisispora phaffii CBS 4417]CCE63081.1 hypothetical protein TPHA_0D04470 [Tetrapisispora phaffii CBS 4417]
MEEVPIIDNNEIKNHILKTVNYIKEHGKSFEDELRLDEKFSFVNPDNEYHKYYQCMLDKNLNDHKLEQNAKEGKQTIEEEDNISVDELNDNKVEVPNEPHPFFFSNYDTNLKPKSFEILKLTAQFVVCNEDINYLEKLKTKYIDNPQFAFLNENHDLNKTFNVFVNQYKEILNNKIVKPLMFGNNLKGIDFKRTVLERSFKRAEYLEYQAELGQKFQKEKNLLDIEYAAINWTKFKVLTAFSLDDPNTLDKDNVDEYNKPINLQGLKLKEISKNENTTLIYFQSIEPINKKEELEVSKQGKHTKRKMKVKAAGETRNKKLKSKQNTEVNDSDIKDNRNKSGHYIECPITKKMVPVAQFDRYLQTLLGDPKYKEERTKFEQKHKMTNLTDAEAYENIKKMARKD